MVKSFMKNSVGTITDMAIGGATLHAIGNSGMQSGFKEATEVGVSAAMMGRTFKRFGKGRRGDFF